MKNLKVNRKKVMELAKRGVMVVTIAATVATISGCSIVMYDYNQYRPEFIPNEEIVYSTEDYYNSISSLYYIKTEDLLGEEHEYIARRAKYRDEYINLVEYDEHRGYQYGYKYYDGRPINVEDVFPAPVEYEDAYGDKKYVKSSDVADYVDFYIDVETDEVVSMVVTSKGRKNKKAVKTQYAYQTITSEIPISQICDEEELTYDDIVLLKSQLSEKIKVKTK